MKTEVCVTLNLVPLVNREFCPEWFPACLLPVVPSSAAGLSVSRSPRARWSTHPHSRHGRDPGGRMGTERSVMKRSLKLQSLGKTNAVMTFACHLSYDWSDALCIICVIISVLPCTWQRWPWWNRFSGEILSWLTMRSNIWLSPTFHLFKVKKKKPTPHIKKTCLFFFFHLHHDSVWNNVFNMFQYLIHCQVQADL